MKPLLISSSYAPHRGGVEQTAGRLARGLSDIGHEPLVVTNRWPKSLPRASRDHGVPVIREVFRVPEPTARQLAGWAATGEIVTRRLVRTARRHGCDVLNIHCISSNSGYALALSRRLGLPIVMSLHGELSGDASSVYQRSRWLRGRWHLLAERAAVITAPSRHTLQEAEQFYGRPFGVRGRVIPNGIDLRLFEPGETLQGRSGVLAVGRLVGVKGFDILLEAWGRLPAQARGGHRLSVVGEGPEEPVLRQVIRSRGLDGQVQLLGGRSEAEVAALMQRTSVVVVPSRQEAFGIVALEAAAAGCRVIGTRVGGLTEVVQSVDGLLVDPEDTAGLTLTLERALQEPAPVPGARSRRSLDWAEVTEQYLEAYRDAQAAA